MRTFASWGSTEENRRKSRNFFEETVGEEFSDLGMEQILKSGKFSRAKWEEQKEVHTHIYNKMEKKGNMKRLSETSWRNSQLQGKCHKAVS